MLNFHLPHQHSPINKVTTMKILKKEEKLCISCMENHIVETRELEETATFKGVKITYIAIYDYCTNTDEFWETEKQMRQNSIARKNAYKVSQNLLTSNEIKNIRKKYNVDQKTFASILGWGKATVARYETHQVQNRSHDDVLRRINEDPNYFISMLERSKGIISPKTYQKCLEAASVMLSGKSYSDADITCIYAETTHTVSQNPKEKWCFENKLETEINIAELDLIAV